MLTQIHLLERLSITIVCVQLEKLEVRKVGLPPLRVFDL